MPLDELAKHLETRFWDQAKPSRQANQLAQLAVHHMPNDTDAQASEALLVALKQPLSDLDNGLCEFAGYFEALVLRLSRSGEVIHG